MRSKQLQSGGAISNRQDYRYKPLKLCLISRCGLPLLVAIDNKNNSEPCVNQVVKQN